MNGQHIILILMDINSPTRCSDLPLTHFLHPRLPFCASSFITIPCEIVLPTSCMQRTCLGSRLFLAYPRCCGQTSPKFASPPVSDARKCQNTAEVFSMRSHAGPSGRCLLVSANTFVGPIQPDAKDTSFKTGPLLFSPTGTSSRLPLED